MRGGHRTFSVALCNPFETSHPPRVKLIFSPNLRTYSLGKLHSGHTAGSAWVPGEKHGFSLIGHMGSRTLSSLLPPYPQHCLLTCSQRAWGFPGGSDSEESTCNAGDPGSTAGSGRSTGGGHGNPLQYSCLENPVDGGVWWATVQGLQRVGHNWSTWVPQSIRNFDSVLNKAKPGGFFRGKFIVNFLRKTCVIWEAEHTTGSLHECEKARAPWTDGAGEERKQACSVEGDPWHHWLWHHLSFF